MPKSELSAGFESPFYAEARANRLRNLFAHVDRTSLAGKRVLELGCGTGDLGEELVKIGSAVVSVDARPEHIQTLRHLYPGRDARVLDLENFDPAGLTGFDAVLSFGLLYHIEKPELFLTRCAALADTMYLETMVCDSREPVCLTVAEAGFDQAFAPNGCRPSAAWIAWTMAACGFDTRDISTGLANWGGPSPSVFDWPERGDGRWHEGSTYLRKMFVCTRRATAARAA